MSYKRFGIALIIIVTPIIIGWLVLGAAPVQLNENLSELLNNKKPLIVDVRKTEKDTGPLKNSIKLNPDSTASIIKFAEQYQSSPLLVVCDGGLVSISVARTLIEHGARSVWYLDGGLQKNRNIKYTGLLAANPEPEPVQPMTEMEQYGAIVAAYVIKPIYMVLSFLMVVLLFRRGKSRYKPLMIGLFLFWAGEKFCMLNYLIYHDESYIMEYLHSAGMILCFGYVMLWVIDTLKTELLSLDHSKRCAFIPLCSRCTHSETTMCKIESLQRFGSFAGILLALLPLSMGIKVTSYTSSIFGSDYFYSHPALYQVYELRILPVTAIVLFLLSLISSHAGKERLRTLSDDLFAFGFGVLGFMYFRAILYGLFATKIVYFHFWEEATELLFIAFVYVYLWTFDRDVYKLRKNKGIV